MHFSNGKVHIYLNNTGSLDTLPSWTYDSAGVGTALAFGDINGDCWPDLVVGNSGDPSMMVFYAQPPEFGDLDDDGAIDLFDYAILRGCLTGPDGEVTPACKRADLDCDVDADLQDFAAFQSAFAGSQ